MVGRGLQGTSSLHGFPWHSKGILMEPLRGTLWAPRDEEEEEEEVIREEEEEEDEEEEEEEENEVKVWGEDWLEGVSCLGEFAVRIKCSEVRGGSAITWSVV